MWSPVDGRVVGRDALLADLIAWLEPALSGRGRSVLLSGEPGIGKSTLVEALSEWAEAAGLRVFRGWCVEARMPPYWPWRAVLSAQAVGPRFGPSGIGGPDVSGAKLRVGTRTELFAEAVEAIEIAGREQPLCIAIDDLQWADPASLRLLLTVASAVPALPVALVLTARDDPADAPEATWQALADLPTSVRRVTVPPLERRWAAELIRRVAGAVLPDDTVSDVVDRTGGNPFFVSEVARLIAHGGWGGPLVVPTGVREAVQRRVARLPQACYTVLTAAAVAGESATAGQGDIDAALVAAVCGTDASTVGDRLEGAVRAGLIRPDPSNALRLRFHHALVRTILATSLSNLEQARLHRRVAEVLAEQAGLAERAGLADPAGGVEQRLAYHWSRAAGPDTAEQAGRWSLRAADVAMRALAFEQAAEHLDRALAAPGVDPIGLRIRLGEAQRLAGDLVAARTTLAAAAHLAEDHHRPDDLAAAALGIGGGIAGFEVPIADGEQVHLLRRAQAALPDQDSPLRAAVLARLSVALTGLAGVGERLRLAERAVAVAERSGWTTGPRRRGCWTRCARTSGCGRSTGSEVPSSA